MQDATILIALHHASSRLEGERDDLGDWPGRLGIDPEFHPYDLRMARVLASALTRFAIAAKDTKRKPLRAARRPQEDDDNV